jgi:hypothetical protein
MEIRVLVEASPTNPPLTFPDGNGGYWLVPPKFEATSTDDSLQYDIRLVIGKPPDTALLGILQVEITRRTNGSNVPIHAAGLRSISLFELLDQAIREASHYLTHDEGFGGLMVTLPKPESIPTKTKHKISRARNHDNSVAVAYVKELQAAGVADWATQTCNDFGISRATLYRRLKAGGYKVSTKPTKKRGGK